MSIETVNPTSWPRPRGYANGILATGPTLFVAGQIGWTPEGVFEKKDFIGQFDQALANVLAVVEAAGGSATSVVRMTVYVTDLDAYRQALSSIGEVWKRRLGRHFPAMALVGVAGLVEREALVEIEATAVIDIVPPSDKEPA
jgi:enamine deaminase RidA (YjgF/YER057c/UK114 family)